MLNSNNNTEINEIYANVVSILINTEILFVARHNTLLISFGGTGNLTYSRKTLLKLIKFVNLQGTWQATFRPYF